MKCISNIKSQIKNIQQERLSYVNNASFMISISINKDHVDYVIVEHNNDEPSDNIIHYSKDKARELITAAFHYSRDCKGLLEGIPYEVVGVYYPANSEEELPQTISPSEIEIKPGGGYYSNRLSKERIVDLLLFAPFTNRYEILKATMTIDSHCYVDIKRYRDFIYKYGKPEIDLYFNSGHSSFKNWANLNQESVLMMFGYTVSQESGLTHKQRISILRDIVDLELLSVSAIVRMLDFFVSTHSNEKDYIARIKWIEDRECIKDYKANPERFLIAAESYSI